MTVMGLSLVIFIGRVLLVACAVATTAFPLVYSRAPWYKTVLGRATMTQAIVLALAIDLRFILTFYYDPKALPYLLWVNVGILAAITLTSASLTYLVISFRRNARRERLILNDGHDGVEADAD